MVLFDLPHLYYLPQYLPVLQVLRRRDVKAQLIAYQTADSALPQILEQAALPTLWVKTAAEALRHYQQIRPQWVIFGNGFAAANQLNPPTRSALLYHASGMGFKTAAIHPDMRSIQVRFLAGDERLDLFKQHFPNTEMVVTGFAKLDPLFDPTSTLKFDIAAHGLIADRPCLLYAPTFYPSSIECMPPDWPAQFSEYTLLVKAHDFTLKKTKYRRQRRQLEHWREFPNVYVAESNEYSLIPFMAAADLMISDKSSAIFEFMALDKPIVICDFVKHRWTYRGIFKWRLKQRLMQTQRFDETATHISRYPDLKSHVQQQLADPSAKSLARRELVKRTLGICDGKAAERIVDYLLNH